MKRIKVIGLLVAMVAFLCPVQSWAGATAYYKNLSIAIKNPETAKGRVYLTPYEDSDTLNCYISKDPKIAKVNGSLTTYGSKFKVYMYALPNDGYVLDCLTTYKAYASGNYRSEYLGNEDGRPISSDEIILDEDTTQNCTKFRPSDAKSLPPVKSYEFYSIFVPSKKSTVKNKHAGAVASAVKASRYGETTNDLVVTGPLNKEDFQYLNKLSQNKGLIRLDLSGAKFTTIPDSAFYKSGLYELKLPSDVVAVGRSCFEGSKGLKPIKFPSGVIKGERAISGCRLMNLMGVKE